MPAVLLRDIAYAAYPRISSAAVMATIHNLAYQGWLSRAQLAGLATPDEIAQLVAPDAEGLLLLREGSSAPSWSTPSAPATRTRF